MKFDIQDVQAGEELTEFRNEWIGLTLEENKILSGKEFISTAQMLVINLYCQNMAPYRTDNPDATLMFESVAPGQMELEALNRARNRALAKFFMRKTE